MSTHLDLDILRTLVTGMDLGSFAKAADRLGRSQPAVSLQLRKLEEQAGVELLRKHGRGLVLTEAGEVMLAYARRLLALNDEAMSAVRGPGVSGTLRFGLPQDFAETWFPTTLAQFSRAHPQTQIAVTVGRNAELLDRFDRGELDLVLVLSQGLDRPRVTPVLNLPMAWIGARDLPGLRRALVVAGGWSLLGSLGFAVLFALGGHLFVDLQTSLPAVRATAYHALPWLAVLPLVGVWSYLLDGLFVGATRAREMRDGMLLSALLFAVLAWGCRGWGNDGLWFAFLAFMAMRGLSLGWIALQLRRRHAWIAAPLPG